VSKKEKLLDKLRSLPSDFTWDEAVKVMKQHKFQLVKNTGSRRTFRHENGVKVSIHEPHPQNTLLKYAMENLIEALVNAGEIK
jgi:predicted RNA binding protein YcfA (HicA-like mRNA interferase family)